MAAPTETDLKFFHCEERSALPTNGGLLSTTEIISKALNNVWPHVLRAERDSGSNLKRKIGLKVHQDGNGTLASTLFCIDGPTLGDDWLIMYAATATDTEADIGTPARIYCAGGLVNAITAGDSTVTFAVKDASETAGIADGDEFRLSDKLTPESLTGNVEYHVVSGAPVVSGLQITVTTAAPIANSYAAYADGTGGKVGAIYDAGPTAAGSGTPVITSAGDGSYDFATYPVTFNNQGADEHTLTLTFTDASNFTAASNRFGPLGAGSKGADFSPLHPFWAKPLLTLAAAGWTGTYQAGDTVVIPLHACAAYVWEERIVPPGCLPLSNNRVILVHRSEGI
jgi:hypothetical protein